MEDEHKENYIVEMLKLNPTIESLIEFVEDERDVQLLLSLALEQPGKHAKEKEVPSNQTEFYVTQTIHCIVYGVYVHIFVALVLVTQEIICFAMNCFKDAVKRKLEIDKTTDNLSSAKVRKVDNYDVSKTN